MAAFIVADTPPKYVRQRMRPQGQSGDNAEPAAAALERPEQIGI